MSEEIKKETQDVELNPENLGQVSGGAGMLEQLVTMIERDGRANELKTILKTEGKAAATAKCIEYYPQYCGYAATAVCML